MRSARRCTALPCSAESMSHVHNSDANGPIAQVIQTHPTEVAVPVLHRLLERWAEAELEATRETNRLLSAASASLRSLIARRRINHVRPGQHAVVFFTAVKPAVHTAAGAGLVCEASQPRAAKAV